MPISEVWIGDILTDRDTLSVDGYTLERHNGKAKIDNPPESGKRARTIDISYAVLKRHGRVVASFDANYHSGMGGMGNTSRFGMFPLLGGSQKQLIVSQDTFRNGAQWIVSLSPRFHIIFDGLMWGDGVGGEVADMKIVDLDHDGVYEITVPIKNFYDLWDKMSISEIPLPEIIFKYDAQWDRYSPANPSFPDYALRNVSTEQCGVDSADELWVRSRILHVLLDYVYAGQEAKGWAFFDQEYKLSDKLEFQQRIRSILNDESVYNYIYRKH